MDAEKTQDAPPSVPDNSLTPWPRGTKCKSETKSRAALEEPPSSEAPLISYLLMGKCCSMYLGEKSSCLTL